MDRRAYVRTLFLVLCKAVHDLYPQGSIKILFPVSNGYYCEPEIGEVVSPDNVAAIRHRMRALIDADLPIEMHKKPKEEVLELFKDDESKVRLMRGVDTETLRYCSLVGYNDSFYGEVLSHTGAVSLFGLEMYINGMLLRIPDANDPTKLGKFIRQDKMFDVFMESHSWQKKMGLSNIGTLNQAIDEGYSSQLITVSEAMQEKHLSKIADDIASRDVKVVMIAGPSSSGKTTTCKRLSVQLVINGIWPKQMSMDDYYVDRENTPLDENGEYDFESLHALNLELFNEHVNALINGEEVELPRYNFATGKSEKSGKKLKLKENEILVIEGIHALNPDLTSSIPQRQIFRLYASALTTIMLDDHNYVSTTDNRLIRRMVRDYKYRNTSAEQTLARWASVRRGEDKWIFPFQENADAVFNTALLFELAVLKSQAESLLFGVKEDSPQYSEARRLIRFLRHIAPMSEDQIPFTSLLREFLGGSSFEY
ncbi:MAG: nucleoside kinase [Prevotella sp.]|nr:nucleoside kinase [Prevotella sp.]MBO6234625.1 nucleoside kinase [Prevotella sp.]MBP3750336.1 nucleoside kinase [Prevotella sp.]